MKMFGGTEFLLFTVVLVNAVNPEITSASDVQICVDLCASCGGTSSFEEQVCRCRIPDNDEKASECMKHVQKEHNENLKLGLSVGGETTYRDTRCCPSKSKKQMRSTDVDRVIKYFVNGGPTRGMAMGGNAQEHCEKNGTTSPEMKSRSRAAASLAKKRVEPATERSASGQGNGEPDAMTEVGITTTTPSSSEEEVHNPHAIEPRSFLRYQNRLLSTLPQVLLSIPQALATAAVAPSNGAQYSLLSVSQRPNIFHGSQYPYLLRAPPSLSYGLRSEQPIQIQLPADNQQHTDAVTQGQLMNSYLGVPNALLAQTPFPYESLLRAPQYDPVFGSIEPRVVDVQRDAPKTTDEKVTSPEAPKLLSAGQKSEEPPTPLHEAIAQQNLLLRALSERLHDYTSALGVLQSEQSRNSVPEAPRPTKQCDCSDEAQRIGTTKAQAQQASDRVTRSRNKAAGSAERSTSAPERKSTQTILQQKASRAETPTTSTPIKNAQENSTNGDQVSKAYRRSAMENEEYLWQFLPHYLSQFSQNSFLTYRKKRSTLREGDQ